MKVKMILIIITSLLSGLFLSISQAADGCDDAKQNVMFELSEESTKGHTHNFNIDVNSICLLPATCGQKSKWRFDVGCECGETQSEMLSGEYATHDYTIRMPIGEPIKNATCTESASYDTYKCQWCSQYSNVSSYTVGEALGHEYSEFVEVLEEATCTSPEYSLYKCVRCNETKVIMTHNALGHDYSERCINDEYAINTTAVVDSEAATYKHKCSRCETLGGSYQLQNNVEDFIALAKSQVGNDAKDKRYHMYFPDLGGREAWCTLYVNWCARNIGKPLEELLPVRGVQSTWNWLRQKKLTYARGAKTPERGDLIFFDWNGDKTLDHIGIVEFAEDGVVHTIEGNATYGEGSAHLVREKAWDINHEWIYGYAKIF